MKIESDQKPKNDKELTIADVKKFFAKLELLEVPDTARVKAWTSIRSHVTRLEVSTDDIRRPQLGDDIDFQPPRRNV